MQHEHPGWMELATTLRDVAKMWGVPNRQCLPGEAEDCGTSAAAHCMSYAAQLQARAEWTLKHLHNHQPAGVELAEALLDHWRLTYTTEDMLGDYN